MIFDRSITNEFLCVLHRLFGCESNYPPAKPEALRWLDPQRGLTATVGKRPLTRPRPSATLSPRERERVSPRGSAPRETPALSPGRGWTAAGVFISRGGTGEGSFPGQRTVTPEDVKLLLPHRQSRGISRRISTSTRMWVGSRSTSLSTDARYLISQLMLVFFQQFSNRLDGLMLAGIAYQIQRFIFA